MVNEKYYLTSCCQIGSVRSVPCGIFEQEKKAQLSWSKPHCSHCEAADKICCLTNHTKQHEIVCVGKSKTSKGLILRFSLLLITLTALCYVRSSNKVKKENGIRIEIFLDDYTMRKLMRYTYAEFNRITNQFRDRLGVGGYGIIYKG